MGRGEHIRIYTSNETLARIINRDKSKSQTKIMSRRKEEKTEQRKAPVSPQSQPTDNSMNVPVQENLEEKKESAQKEKKPQENRSERQKEKQEVKVSLSEDDIKKILKKKGYDEKLSSAICTGITKAKNELTVDVMIRIELAKTDVNKKDIPEIAGFVMKAIKTCR